MSGDYGGLSLSGRPGGILLFGLIISTAGLLLMRRNLVRGLSLTLDERAITDRSSFRRRRFLPWEVMTSVLVDPLGVLVSFDRSRPAFGALPLRQRVLPYSENYGTGIYVLARYLADAARPGGPHPARVQDQHRVVPDRGAADPGLPPGVAARRHRWWVVTTIALVRIRGNRPHDGIGGMTASAPLSKP